MNWRKRGAYILGSFITGYSGGFGVVFAIDQTDLWDLSIKSFMVPIVAGIIVALPQLGKVITEYSNTEDN